MVEQPGEGGRIFHSASPIKNMANPLKKVWKTMEDLCFQLSGNVSITYLVLLVLSKKSNCKPLKKKNVFLGPLTFPGITCHKKRPNLHAESSLFAVTRVATLGIRTLYWGVGVLTCPGSQGPVSQGLAGEAGRNLVITLFTTTRLLYGGRSMIRITPLCGCLNTS